MPTASTAAPPRMSAPTATPNMSFSRMKEPANSSPSQNPTSGPPPDLVDLPFDGQSCNGSMTRKRSMDALTKKVSVKITNVPLMMIVDELVSKEDKYNKSNVLIKLLKNLLPT